MKAAVLVSGGVDSSVALQLLKQSGKYDLTAFYLKIWLEDEFQFLGECPWEEDLKYAKAVCDQAGVPLEVVSLQTAYWDKVVSHTVEELKEGRTPSPDILCNQRVKFGAFCDFIDDSYHIASGHYAQVERQGGMSWLLKGNDPIKDQTYFLSRLSQEQLARCLFPVGQYPKAEVRALAQKYDLVNQSRKDSQGICFLGKIKYSEFVKAHLGEKQGLIMDADTNEAVGEHKGFWFHTIGQRKGLGLSGGPWFVVRKDCANNIVYVSKNKLDDERPQTEFSVGSVHWISSPPEPLDQLSVKLRHGEKTIPCTIDLADSRGVVQLDEPDAGIAPGQYAVFYRGEVCLGSGMIL
ncbi:tRNA 2-thiouridine(34) synthase MnmA [Pseudobacteriovorax antillogorgiicola]|uniref:tRNA-specific 2-thiouridylase MnmA n=1 Tax=Pseudobacteriovorax antillogorgiicola TaxID=1513793 RepID=A0A1Y6B727_9BACT|nr:tRNA 2-thiouridine(34) synthase MnmA [Pseudobacteriovorax antillogorgiicola]TCS58665.1 tRNA (5-methylaminomethyl-2-thiouridylate)-methyltransferase [Pseudobacteriovorax antillogorgiicola]SME96163.1 tRNA-specific 2-thiouridylase [Pseudobacteriovorax antillogorgiicola]